MGASVSTPAAPTVRAEAMMAVPPQGCPMHQEAPPLKPPGNRHTASVRTSYCLNFTLKEMFSVRVVKLVPEVREGFSGNETAWFDYFYSVWLGHKADCNGGKNTSIMLILQ